MRCIITCGLGWDICVITGHKRVRERAAEGGGIAGHGLVVLSTGFANRGALYASGAPIMFELERLTVYAVLVSKYVD
jgi:hypothetical protein